MADPQLPPLSRPPEPELPPGYRIGYVQGVSPSEVCYSIAQLYHEDRLLQSFEATAVHVPDHPLIRENPEGGEVYRTVYPTRADVIAFAWKHWQSRSPEVSRG